MSCKPNFEKSISTRAVLICKCNFSKHLQCKCKQNHVIKIINPLVNMSVELILTYYLLLFS